MELKKVLLFLFAVFFMLSLACGELVVPVEPLGSGSNQPGNAGAPENEIEEPLATLAPLPGGGGEETADLVEGEVSGSSETEIVVVNDVAWTLLDVVDLGETLESGDDDIPDLVANGRLVGVRFNVTNQGEDSHTLIGLEIIDSSGQRYSYESDGLDFIVEEERCELVDLEPEATITCTAIYDISTEAAGLKGVFNDLSLLGGEEKLVDLSLD